VFPSEVNVPLNKTSSKQAFKDNVAAEVEAGKPQKQAVAIAYAVQRKAKRQYLSEGGPVHRAMGIKPGGKC
jgi:hypothetical protein